MITTPSIVECSSCYPTLYLFDKFIDHVYESDSQNSLIKTDYLVLKIYSLFYTKEDAKYSTTFPEFEANSAMVKKMLSVLQNGRQ